MFYLFIFDMIIIRFAATPLGGIRGVKQQQQTTVPIRPYVPVCFHQCLMHLPSIVPISQLSGRSLAQLILIEVRGGSALSVYTAL